MIDKDDLHKKGNFIFALLRYQISTKQIGRSTRQTAYEIYDDKTVTLIASSPAIAEKTDNTLLLSTRTVYI